MAGHFPTIAVTKQAIDVEAIGMNLYRGSNLWKRSAGRAVFGGQIVGQAITAAQKSVDDFDFLVNSLHCYFVNPTKTSSDVIYEVEQLKNGRSFCTRSVKAWQEDRVVFHALTSFYKVDTPTTNLSHTSSVMPAAPRPPDDDDDDELDKRLISLTDSAGIKCSHMYLYMSEEQLKSCKTKSPTHPRRMLWAKSTLSSEDTQNLHRAALACESDISMAGVVLMKHPNMWTGQEFITSLDHSITFHTSVQSDKWHLFVTECEHAVGTRALNISKIFSEDGILVATCQQESLIRPKL